MFFELILWFKRVLCPIVVSKGTVYIALCQANGDSRAIMYDSAFYRLIHRCGLLQIAQGIRLSGKSIKDLFFGENKRQGYEFIKATG